MRNISVKKSMFHSVLLSCVLCKQVKTKNHVLFSAISALLFSDIFPNFRETSRRDNPRTIDTLLILQNVVWMCEVHNQLSKCHATKGCYVNIENYDVLEY